MKDSLLPHLVCPTCLESLDLTVEHRDRLEIERGALHCRRCAAAYPIVRWIPRFVSSDAYATTFSYQWDIHRKTQVDSLAGHDESRKTFLLKTGFTDAELRKALALDVGCGTGRFMEIAVSMGAAVIGVDLSYAVDSAFANMGRREGVHLVQADLFKLPFRPGTFDTIYSIGVLHHTPSTRDAFLGLPPLVKPGGLIAIWVYGCEEEYTRYVERVRLLTVRIPKRLLYWLCWLCVPVLHTMLRVPLLWRVAVRIPTSEQHRGLRWDVLDTFDQYAPRYRWNHTEPEVREWFEKAGLEDVSALSFPVSMRGRRPARGA